MIDKGNECFTLFLSTVFVQFILLQFVEIGTIQHLQYNLLEDAVRTIETKKKPQSR